MAEGAIHARKDSGLMTWAEAERHYTRPPTARAIVKAFREEVKEVVPRRLRLAEKALMVIEELLVPSLLQVPPEVRPAAWLLLRVAWGLEELEVKIRHYRYLLALARRRRGRPRGVDAAEIKRRVNIVEVC